MEDKTLADVHGWAEKQRSAFAEQAGMQPDRIEVVPLGTDCDVTEPALVFAPVCQDIHEDMKQIYGIATAAAEFGGHMYGVEAYQQIADIASGWIED